MRNHFSKFAMMATIGLALTFTFSCTTDVEPPPPEPGSPGSSSSQGTSQITGNIFTDARDGKQYKFEIAPNNRIWMSENLNYSKNNTLGYCYGVNIDGANPHKDSTSCGNGYGRIYEFAVAMDGNPPQGLCPNEWHIPSTEEWSQIVSTSARKMSSDFYIYPGNYNLNTEFLPTGWKERDKNGFYWTSSGNSYYTLFLSSGPLEAKTTTFSPNYFSIRCIANDFTLSCGTTSYNPTTQFCSGGMAYDLCGGKTYNPAAQFCSGTDVYALCNGKTYDPSKQECVGTILYSKCGTILYNPASKFCSGTALYDLCGGNDYNPVTQECIGGIISSAPSTFTDSRDGKIYKRVNIIANIGTQVWMAENLNYNASGSKCYENTSAKCTTYGRLYNWATAKTACPDGWHLPTQAEWNILTAAVGGSATEGKRLKAKSGWNLNDDVSGNGLDTYGFSALPGGAYSDSFSNVGYYGYWWSASEYNANNAYRRLISYNNESASWNNMVKSNLYSVRCVKD